MKALSIYSGSKSVLDDYTINLNEKAKKKN